MISGMNFLLKLPLLIVLCFALLHVNLLARAKGLSDATAAGPTSSRQIVIKLEPTPRTQADIDQDARREEEQKRTNRWNIRLTAVIALAALLQFCSSIGQILVYRRQSRIMADALGVSAEQAKAAEAAAEASERSTEALINGERAWISVTPSVRDPELRPLWEDGDPVPSDPELLNPFSHGFPATIRNVGRTPARVEEVYVQYEMLQRSPNELPTPPVYTDVMREQSFLLVPNEETSVLTFLSTQGGFLTKNDVAAIYGQRAFLYAYGIVKYKDVFERKHETRFGYVYEFPQGFRINFERIGFRCSGPEQYNRQT